MLLTQFFTHFLDNFSNFQRFLKIKPWQDQPDPSNPNWPARSQFLSRLRTRYRSLKVTRDRIRQFVTVCATVQLENGGFDADCRQLLVQLRDKSDPGSGPEITVERAPISDIVVWILSLLYCLFDIEWVSSGWRWVVCVESLWHIIGNVNENVVFCPWFLEE